MRSIKACPGILGVCVMLAQTGCVGVHTHVGGTSDADGMKLDCYGDCYAWDVAQDVAQVAEEGIEAAAGWVSLPAGRKPHDDQIARCTKFSADMTDVCAPFLRKAVIASND